MHAGGLPLTDAYRDELWGMNRTVGVDSLQGLQAGDPLTTWIIQASQPDSSVLKAADAANWAIVDKVRGLHLCWALIWLVAGRQGHPRSIYVPGP